MIVAPGFAALLVVQDAAVCIRQSGADLSGGFVPPRLAHALRRGVNHTSAMLLLLGMPMDFTGKAIALNEAQYGW